MLSLEELNSKIISGRAAMRPGDPEALFQIASRCETYVEIGTKWGGSAIVAGLAGCEVHCIDHWEYPGRRSHKSSPATVKENWLGAGLDPDKLFLHVQRHPPWPEAIEDKKFDMGLIDGSHYEEAGRLDWEAMKEHVTGYILFHDYDFIPRHDGIKAVFEEAESDPEWELEHHYGILRCAPS